SLLFNHKILPGRARFYISQWAGQFGNAPSARDPQPSVTGWSHFQKTLQPAISGATNQGAAFRRAIVFEQSAGEQKKHMVLFQGHQRKGPNLPQDIRFEVRLDFRNGMTNPLPLTKFLQSTG